MATSFDMSILQLFLALFATILLSILVFLYVYFIHHSLAHYRYYRSHNIPTARYIPVTGHLPSLFRYDKANNPMCFWREPHIPTIQPLYALNLGPQTHLQVNDPHYLFDITKRNAASIVKSAATRMYLEPNAGAENLLLLEGDEHRRHRRMINPGFHYDKLHGMVDTMVSESDKQIDCWLTAIKQSSDGSVDTDLHKDMSTLTFGIIAGCAFGAGFSHIPDAANTLQHNIVTITQLTQHRAFTLVGILPLINQLPLFGKPTIDSTRREMFDMVDSVIRERREGRSTAEGSGGYDLLQLLLEAEDVKTGEKLTDKEVRDEAMTFVLAGHDTTANLMSWMLWKLMTTPQLWQQCRQEILSVCDMDAPTSSQLKELVIIDAVINESLRLYPPVPLLSKQVATTHTIQPHPPNPALPSFTAQAGAEFIIGIHLIHRSPEYWGATAAVFDHTRWLQSGKRPYSHELAFLPFSWGDRGCIGSLFARMEAKVMLCRILQRVSMEMLPGQLLDSEGAPVHSAIVTMRPKYGIMTRITAVPV